LVAVYQSDKRAFANRVENLTEDQKSAIERSESLTK
jgi:hypothetical protein